MDVKERVRKAITFDFVDYIHKEDDDYDVHTYECLAGHRDKLYYRIDTTLFAPFIKELNDNPNSSYITSINNLVLDGYVPKKVSVLNKLINSNNYNRGDGILKLIYAEVLSSQILNFFGCPTAYNAASIPETETSCQILSLDFLSYGEVFLSFDDLDCSFGGDLADNVRMIKYEFRMNYFSDYIKEDLDKTVEDYVYSFLVRRYILKDRDFYDANSGIIANKETGEVKYINFDFEYAFGEARSNLEENLRYCIDNYPGVYEKFVKMIKEFHEGLEALKSDFVLQNHDYVYRNIMEEMLWGVSGIIKVTDRLSRKR